MKESLGKIIGLWAFSIVMTLCLDGFAVDPANRLEYVQIAGGVFIIVWGAKVYKNRLIRGGGSDSE